jgi:hypothetical protein
MVIDDGSETFHAQNISSTGSREVAFGCCARNATSADFAGEFVSAQGKLDALSWRHAAVALDLS